MNEAISPIFLDGPLKGEDYPVPLSQLDYQMRYIPPGTPLKDQEPQQLTYYFHPFVILGNRIWFASLQSNFQAISWASFREVFKIIASERAMQAHDPR